MLKHTIARALITATGLAALALPSAHADIYTLHQDGFPDGGEITLQLDAVDLNHDGFIDSWGSHGEIRSFSVDFSSATGTPYHSGIQEATISGFLLTYKADGGLLGDDPQEGIYAITDEQFGYSVIGKSATQGFTSSFFDGRAGSTVNRFGESLNPITVTISAVPEPGSHALLLTGLLGIAAVSARRRQG